MVRRWQQLPLDRALSHEDAVRTAAQRLLGEPMPALGPATTVDQLQVAVYDACAAGQTDQVLSALIELRRLIG
ncbi:hypothetical protein [Calidifontibacter terrae]